MAQAARVRPDEGTSGGQGMAIPEPVNKVLEYPKRWRQFLHEVRVEMKQVNWPTREDVVSTTAVVIITVAFFGVFFGIVDTGLNMVIQRLIRIFSH